MNAVWRWVLSAAIVAAAVVALLAGWTRSVEIDVAPLARVTWNGKRAPVGNDKTLERNSPDAIHEGLPGPPHAYRPPDLAPGVLELRLPFALRIAEVAVVTGGVANKAPKSVFVQFGDGASWAPLPLDDWLPATARAPGRGIWHVARPIRALRVEIDPRETEIAALACTSIVPIAVAWTGAAALTIFFPWLCGMAMALAIFAAGACIAPRGGVGAKITAGLTAVGVTTATWCIVPRSPLADGAILAAFGFAGLAGFVLLWRGKSPAGFSLVPATTLLLVAITAADSYGLTGRRVEPDDFWLPGLTAKHLAEAAPMPPWLTLRPWLGAAMWAPLDGLSDPFEHFAYLGMIAGLNALAAPLLESLMSARLGSAAARRATLWLLLAPLLPAFHFLGVRLLAAALALAAIGWQVKPPGPRSWLTAGFALTLGIGFHPSIAFLLPGLLLWSVTRPAPSIAARLAACGRAVGIPAALYGTWLIAMANAYPGTPNELLRYPIKPYWSAPTPPGMSVLEQARSLTGEEWRQLAWNRVQHLRHYLWTDNKSADSPHARFRWISLPNALGWAGLLLLPFAIARNWSTFGLLAIAAPLLIHHLHIGDAWPQFHISPAPFVALGVLLAESLATRVPRWVCGVVLSEWAFRAAWPLWLAASGGMPTDVLTDSLRLLGLQPGARLAWTAAPLLAWSWIGWKLARAGANERHATEGDGASTASPPIR